MKSLLDLFASIFAWDFITALCVNGRDFAIDPRKSARGLVSGLTLLSQVGARQEMAVDPKSRFTDRVEDYVQFRPGYPPALFRELTRIANLCPDRVVADVGSGTGIFARSLLRTGARVIAVEPNAAMRAAAYAALSHEPHFTSLNGSAEATGLADASVDLVAAAQAFHWFDPAKARVEFGRILRPGGLVALVWNQRKDTPFNRDYDSMLNRLAPDYHHVREKDRAAESKVRAFYRPCAVHFAVFDNQQFLDEAGLRGRLNSSSYAPRRGQPGYEEILRELNALFPAHQKDGLVTIAYDTVLWCGSLV